MRKFSKKILAFILTVCLILQLMPNQLTVYAASEPQYYGWTASGDPNLHNPQANLIWNGCFIYSAAMLMTANGISNSTPYDLYRHLGGNGSNTPGFTWDKISPHYSFNKYSGNLTGSYDNKLQTVERLVKEHSQGIILSINNNAVNFVSPFDGKSHTQQHFPYLYNAK